MPGITTLYIARLLPVAFATAAAMAYVFYVEGNDAYAVRNMAPMLAVLLLASITLVRGGGHWAGKGWRWPLGTIGFAIPAIGLSIYLHYGYMTDLDGMYSQAVFPRELFRYLPIYTFVAGAVGFAIGWIAGRNI